MRELETILHDAPEAKVPEADESLSKAEQKRIYEMTMQKILPETQRGGIAMTKHTEQHTEPRETSIPTETGQGGAKHLIGKICVGAVSVAAIVGMAVLLPSSKPIDSPVAQNSGSDTSSAAALTSVVTTDITTTVTEPAVPAVQEKPRAYTTRDCIVDGKFFYLPVVRSDGNESIAQLPELYSYNLATGETENVLAMFKAMSSMPPGAVEWFICTDDSTIIFGTVLQPDTAEEINTVYSLNLQTKAITRLGSIDDNLNGSPVFYKNKLYFSYGTVADEYPNELSFYSMDLSVTNAQPVKLMDIGLDTLEATSLTIGDDAIYLVQIANRGSAASRCFIGKYNLDGTPAAGTDNGSFYDDNMDYIDHAAYYDGVVWLICNKNGDSAQHLISIDAATGAVLQDIVKDAYLWKSVAYEGKDTVTFYEIDETAGETHLCRVTPDGETVLRETSDYMCRVLAAKDGKVYSLQVVPGKTMTDGTLDIDDCKFELHEIDMQTAEDIYLFDLPHAAGYVGMFAWD